MILPVALLLLGLGALWLAVRSLQDARRHEGDFSEWIVSDATPLNRRLWRVDAWIRMIALMIAGATCLFCAFMTLGK